MAIAITNYCTTDEVRSILGVSDLDIEDVTLLNTVYATGLQEKLYDLHPDIIAYYDSIKSLPSPTTNQTRFKDLLSTFAAYAVAQQCLGSIKMFAPKTIEDSKAKRDLVADPYADLADMVMSSLTYFTRRILSLYQVLVPSATVATAVAGIFIRTPGIAFDPVLNQ